MVGRRLEVDVDFPVHLHGAYDAFYSHMCVRVFSSIGLVGSLLPDVRMATTWSEESGHAAAGS